VHIKEQKQVFDRFGALWTPTQIILDSEGEECHRTEGFLPVEDFLAQLELGLGKLQFHHKRFSEAGKRFQAVCEGYPKSGGAPEACYWAGVAAYKGTDDPKHLGAAGELLKQRYPDSEWARKASVWLH
jgi:outer membrane protein assembly factor BamD (BamD/ComL family)